MLRRRLTALISVTSLVALGLVTSPSWAAETAGKSGDQNPNRHCARLDRITVPGAEKQVVACLDDLTTAGTTKTGHTDPADFAGLNAPGTVNPSGVPGLQIDGYFPDTSTFNAKHGWNHDSQFVIRLPDDWNGGIVIAPPPGTRTQYSSDFIIADAVLAKGYAYASTDKGNSGPAFYKDGAEPGDAVAEWNTRVTELTKATQEVAKQRYRSTPKRTFLFGISNGGYLVRWQLENHPELYTGGVDWEGTYITEAENPLMTAMAQSLKYYPQWAAGDVTAHAKMIDAGFEPGTEYLWPFHYRYYWDFTQRVYREEFDPTWDGDLDAGIPFCASGTPNCDADYDYASRPQSVKDAVAKVELTGRIGKPLITLHGTHDTLLPIRITSDRYDELVDQAGRGHLHRYYRFEGGTHVDSLYPAFPTTVRPLLPCARTSFDALERWVGRSGRPSPRHQPPPDATLARPTSGDLVNTCSLTEGAVGN